MKKTVVIFIICTILFSTLHIMAIEYNNTKIHNESKFPIRYDLREENRVTPVKEQGGIGSCWAVTSIGALESFLLTKEGIEYDLSENNMITQLSKYYKDGFDRLPEHGGDDAIATSYYASWRGPVLESEDSYPESMNPEDVVVRTGVKPLKHVQEILFLPERKNPLDNDLFKEHIIKYGAISAAMWKGTPQTFGKFYSEENFAWYYPLDYMNEEGNGHSVDIVGWDDNFSRENFNTKPPGDGAFIVKNTKGPFWGQRYREENMGGYFYISYYDTMLATKLDSNIGNHVFTRVDDVDNYDHIYQHDILGYTDSIKGNENDKEVWFSNVFEIKDASVEQLSAISFYTLEENLNYEIWINKDYKNLNSFDDLRKIKIGKIDLPGYHTIDLRNSIILDDTKKIAVVVKLISTDITPSIAVESPKGIISSKAKANRGESFLKDSNGWKDMTIMNEDTNACLKIFTKDTMSDNTKLISVNDMKKDVDFLVDWILNHQPVAREEGYNSKQKEIIKEVYDILNKPKTKNEFYLIINRLFTMMGDGHTILYYPPDNPRYLDIPFVWLEEGIIINQSTDKYKIGDKILSIGGKSAKELNSILYSQISSENDYWIRAEASEELILDMILRYYDLMNDDGTVDIEIERNGEVTIYKEPLNKYREYLKKNNREWLSWHIEKENNLGYFQFDLWENGEKLEEIKINMDKFFKEVKENKIENIVFDIRENPGGTAGALNYLLTYLDTDTVYGEEYMPYINNPKVTNGLLFKGNTYFMISNRTFSCSVLATTILKDNGIVTVIGEPSGENPAFNRHGNGSDGELPATGWRFMMTSYRPQRPLDNDESEVAIFPDIPIYTTKEDIISERDIQMEKLREITRNSDWIYLDNKINIFENDKLILSNNEEKLQDEICLNIDIESIDENNIWIEDTIDHNKIKVEAIMKNKNIEIKIPKDLDEGKSYHLVVGDKDKIYAVLMTKVKKIKDKIDSENPFRIVHENRFKDDYLYISLPKNIEKHIKSNGVTLENENGEKVYITRVARGSTAYQSLIIVPIRNLESGIMYTLFIPKGTIEFEDGDIYDYDATFKFVAK